MKKKYFITTPIYYINDVPHIGHSCTTVVADILARYHRQKGDEVFFLTGTDEHGQKVAEAAKEAGLSPREYCDQIAPRFEEAWKELGISYDFFIRTTDKRHEKVVAELLTKIHDRGDIYKAKYEGLYCIGCEKFLTESDLVEGHCPIHPADKTITRSENNWFFRLGKYVPEIIKMIENDESNYISPAGKRSEVLAKLKAGVRDISISREKVEWGIPTPWDPSQTVYVWFDALINYYSATQFVEGKAKFWPADLHLLGKEILWFHTVIWQAMLLSAEIALPKKTYTHSFYIIDGQKMSKSLGNVISPGLLVENFGVDGSRYLIASSFPTENDTDVGLERFKEKYNADLANNLGNLVSRVSRLAEGLTVEDENIRINPKFEEAIDNFHLDEAIDLVFKKWIDGSNSLINRTAPWELVPDDPKRIEVLKQVILNLRQAAWHLKPIMPQSAEKINQVFKGKIKALTTPLFPRIEKEGSKKEKPELSRNLGGEKLLVGKIIKLEKHPQADKLQVVEVDIGGIQKTVVCGANNIKPGQIVPIVLAGGRVNSPKGGVVKVEKGKIRGVRSEGMLCSPLELGISNDHETIYILPDKLEKNLGEDLKKFVKISV